MFDQEAAGAGIVPSVQNALQVTKALSLFLLLSICIVATSWLLAIPTYFDIKVAAQFLPVLACVGMLFLVNKLQHRIVLITSTALIFLIIFTCWSFVLYLDISVATRSPAATTEQTTTHKFGIADAIYLLGLCFSIILLHRFFRFAVYLSSSAIITLVVLLVVFADPEITDLIAIFILLSTTIIISFIVNRDIAAPVHAHKLIDIDNQFDDAELLPSEAEQSIVPELAINALPLNEHSTTHDWELTLRDLQRGLKSSPDVDQLFGSMLHFIHDRIEYDAAAVGMLQDRSLRKIAASGDDEYLHSKSLGWTNQRIKEVFKTGDAILSQQSRLTGDDSVHRLDIPVVSGTKAVGIVTLFRETMIFDTQDVKLASSIVFHSMIALRHARLQEEIKRLSSDSKTTHLTLYSREQFVEKTQAVFDKLGKPRECSVFIVDIDNLGEINDKTGHEAAIALYKAVSKTIMSKLSERDILGRYGKEGFIVLMDETDLNGAKEKAESIRSKISHLKLKYQGQVITTTVSIGLTIVSDPDENLQGLMRKCDMGLFVAKENGCNTVKVSL